MNSRGTCCLSAFLWCSVSSGRRAETQVGILAGYSPNMPPKLASYPRSILQIAHPVITSLRGGLKMPFFECSVSRTIFTDDLKTTRTTENVYVEAKDGKVAKQKAEHPRNWLRSAATLGKAEKSSSFLITVGECRRVADDEAKTLRLVDAAVASALSQQPP